MPERTQHRRVQYDPTCEVPVWQVGMVFENVVQFREAVAKYVVVRGGALRLRPNDGHRVRVTCKKENCD